MWRTRIGALAAMTASVVMIPLPSTATSGTSGPLRGPINESSGINCDGSIFAQDPVPAAFGSVTLTRSASALTVSISLTAGDPGTTYRVELFESNDCTDDNAAATAHLLTTDADGNGAKSFSVPLPYNGWQGYVPQSLLGDGAGSEAAVVVLDRRQSVFPGWDRFVATVPLPPVPADSTPPSITTSVADGATYTLGAVPTPTCTATDDVDGDVGCTGVVSGGTANGTGTFTYTASATDAAGNTRTVVVTYHVRYAWSGFLQPINGTAHEIGVDTSVFKAGSTVPVKFRLTDAAGQIATVGTTPVWLEPVRGGRVDQPVDETVYNGPSDSGSLYRLSGDTWVYNWDTSPGQGGYYWRIGARLDDGSTRYVNIGLR